MEITGDIKTSNTILSDTSALFLEYVERNPACFKRCNFSLLELNDEIFKLQPWPTFINQKIKKEMKDAGLKVYKLIRGIPGRIFGRNPYKISKYYEMPVDVVTEQLDGANDDHINNLMARGDFVLSSSGWKCLEYNITANLGGWQCPLWESLYLSTPVIADFFTQYQVKITNKNLLGQLFSQLIRGYLYKYANDNEINVAFAMPNAEEEKHDDYEATQLYMNELFKTSLQLVSKKFRGKIIFCSFEDLKNINDCLFYNDIKIGILVELHHGSMPGEILNTFKSGNICLYNGPITDLLSNKLNLAFLSENENSKFFTREEREAIKKYIPWTRKTVTGYTTYRRERVKLEDFIRKHREKLVLKPSVGYGGKGISIGRNTSQKQWKLQIETAIREKSWLVQEYVDTTPSLYQWGEGEAALHDSVWGFFIFGSRYAGQWVRVLPKKDNKGVINCHQGASVSVVFEVEK